MSKYVRDEAHCKFPVEGYIVESGSNDNGHWVKWSDGTMICRRTISGTMDITESWGALYRGKDTTQYNFAQAFSGYPHLSLHLQNQNYEAILTSCSPEGSGQIIKPEGFAGIQLIRPTSTTGVNYVIRVLAVGKWK